MTSESIDKSLQSKPSLRFANLVTVQNKTDERSQYRKWVIVIGVNFGSACILVVGGNGTFIFEKSIGNSIFCQQKLIFMGRISSWKEHTILTEYEENAVPWNCERRQMAKLSSHPVIKLMNLFIIDFHLTSQLSCWQFWEKLRSKSSIFTLHKRCKGYFSVLFSIMQKRMRPARSFATILETQKRLLLVAAPFRCFTELRYFRGGDISLQCSRTRVSFSKEGIPIVFTEVVAWKNMLRI